MGIEEQRGSTLRRSVCVENDHVKSGGSRIASRAGRVLTKGTGRRDSLRFRPIGDLASNAVDQSAGMDALRACLGVIYNGYHRVGVALWHRPVARGQAAAVPGVGCRPDFRGGSGGSRIALRQRRGS